MRKSQRFSGSARATSAFVLTVHDKRCARYWRLQMNFDSELQEWRRYWHAQPSVPLDLFRKVEEGTTSTRHYRIAEILVTVFMGGGTLAWAVFHPSTNWILLASGTWFAILLAWIYSLRSTRGIWAAT